MYICTCVFQPSSKLRTLQVLRQNKDRLGDGNLCQDRAATPPQPIEKGAMHDPVATKQAPSQYESLQEGDTTRQGRKRMRAEPRSKTNRVRRGRSSERLAKGLETDVPSTPTNGNVANHTTPENGETIKCEGPPEESTSCRGRTMVRARPRRRRSGRGLRVKLVEREDDASTGDTNGVRDVSVDDLCGSCCETGENSDIRDDISEPLLGGDSDCEERLQYDAPRTRRGRTEHREGWGYRLHPTCPKDDPYFRWRYWWWGWKRHTQPWVQPRVWPSW